jgi:hypothetical protein
MSVRIRSLWLVAIAYLSALGACASTEGASRKMLDLNRQALASYEAGKLPRARDLLVQAVSVGKKNGLTKHNTMARTYLDLGAVYLALNERDKGLRNIGLALRIQPDIEPTDPIATPAVEKALARARVELERRRSATAAADKEEKAEKAEEKAEKSEKAEKPETAPPKKEAPPPRAIVKAAPEKIEKVVEKAPPPAEKVAAAEPPPVDDEEPDLPANVPQPLYCPIPDEAPPAELIALRCVPRPGVSFARIMLFYRSAGSEGFTQVPMVKSRKGWYSGMVPASAVVGKSLQYYVEAQLTGKKTATSNGHSDSPNLLSIREGAAKVGQGTLAAAHFKKDTPVVEAKDDDPLLAAERAREREVTVSSDHRRRVGSVFVGAGIGTGYGWHGKRTLEFRYDQAVLTGFSPGGLHISPELGYQYDERYAFAAQIRFQYIPESGSGDTRAGSPAHGAWAAFARAYRFLGTANGQPFLSGTVGAGQGFRLIVPPNPLPRNDTIRGGPFVLGPGAGFLYHFTPHFAWNAEVRLLAGLPDFAVLAEFSTAGQVSF